MALEKRKYFLQLMARLLADDNALSRKDIKAMLEQNISHNRSLE